MECTISVIVCAYNAEDEIVNSLSSLQAQSWQELEILVIDDGSTDDTPTRVDSIAAKDSRVRLLRNNCNRGTAYARQRGLKAAFSELVVFFDADDLAQPNLIETLYMRLTKDPKCIGVSCYAEYYDSSGPIGVQSIGATDREEFLEAWRNQKLYFQSIVTLTYRSLALKSGGFRLNIMPNSDGIRYEDFAEDLDLWCRMADLGADGRYFVSIPEPLFRYRKSFKSLSTENLKLMQLKMRWIKDCLLRRRRGEAERSLASFISSRTVSERFADWRGDKAATFYKKAGFYYAKRNFAALALYLSLTGVLSPKLLLQKLASQKLIR